MLWGRYWGAIVLCIVWMFSSTPGLHLVALPQLLPPKMSPDIARSFQGRQNYPALVPHPLSVESQSQPNPTGHLPCHLLPQVHFSPLMCHPPDFRPAASTWHQYVTVSDSRSLSLQALPGNLRTEPSSESCLDMFPINSRRSPFFEPFPLQHPVL